MDLGGGEGGLDGIAWGPDGNLYACEHWEDRIYIYNVAGTEVDSIVQERANKPTFGPGGDLYVAPLSATGGGDAVAHYKSPLDPSEPLKYVEGIPVPSPNDGIFLGQVSFLGDDVMFVPRSGRRGGPSGLYRYRLVDGSWTLDPDDPWVVHHGDDGRMYASATAVVPEPSTLVLLLMGAIGLLAYGRRRERAT